MSKDIKRCDCFAHSASECVCGAWNDTTVKIINLEMEIQKLRDILFVIGEIAIITFDDRIVGIVDKTLKDCNYQQPTKEEFEKLLKEVSK